MPGTQNFLQFNPNGQNMESDAQYLADALRSGGFANPSIVSSVLLNKALYQLSTFIAAFAQSLATKNYSVTDASLANLAATLANVMTLADMAGYAPLANPVFTGAPRAPTPATGDSSALVATTAFVKNQGYQASLGFTPVQQGGGAYQGADKIFLGWDGGNLRLQVNATDLGPLVRGSQFSQTLGGNGFQVLPSGLVLQWGFATVTNATVVNFPVSFPNAVFQLVGCDLGLPNAGSSGVNTVSVQPILYNNGQFKGFGRDMSGNYVATNISWMALGR